jgi:hypothetical protein
VTRSLRRDAKAVDNSKPHTRRFRHHWRMRITVMAVAFMALCLVVGCTGTAAPSTSTTGAPVVASTSPTRVSPTPTPMSRYPADVPLTGKNLRTPGEKPPVYPAAAKEKSQQGANAFARFFIQTIDWGYATTSAAYMKHYYEPSCGVCAAFSGNLRNTAARKHHYLGDRLRVSTAEEAPIGPVTAPSDFCSVVVLDHSAGTAVDATGQVINGESAKTGVRFKLCAKMRSSGWMTTYLNRLN